MTLHTPLWLATSAPQRQPRGRRPPTCRRLPTAINLLLEELKLLETKTTGHESSLQDPIRGGAEPIQQRHLGSEKIQGRTQEVSEMWSQLNNQMDERKRRLTDVVNFHQSFTDADDVDNWMLDILKLVSSDDIGKDESNVQTLLKKHKADINEMEITLDHANKALLDAAIRV